jgi:hypothetical protein
MMSSQTLRYRPLEDLRKKIRWLILLRWIAGEFWTFVPSDPLFAYRLSQRLGPNTKYLVGLFAAFAAAVYITVYMTTSIVNTLRRREGELEAAIGRLEIANSALESKDREKSQYVLTVTHDIKG